MENNYEIDNMPLQIIMYLFILVTAIFIGYYVSYFMTEPILYNVEITYCDNRPNEIINIYLKYKPDNYSINNGGCNLSVPTWEGKLNVCNIKVIEN